jgi:hypothetical protein
MGALLILIGFCVVMPPIALGIVLLLLAIAAFVAVGLVALGGGLATFFVTFKLPLAAFGRRSRT